VSARLRAAAALVAVALAGCGGGGGSQTNPILPPAHVGTTAPAKVTIAGVGDSLTAGEQSDFLAGANLPGPLGTNAQLGTIAPNGVQATQEHGFYALLWEQANGVDITAMSNPATSPLPLITPPGIGSVLVPTTSRFPYAISNECDSRQIAANSFSTALSLREAPSVTPYDVAIPGQTTHEALYMTGAIGNCTLAANTPANLVDLNQLVNGESQYIWPILGGFGQGVTQVEAAASLHAQLATVWLGSNDLLKFAFSDGAAPVTSPTSLGSDIATIVRTLQKAGSKVVVANLVDVMDAATFISQPAYATELESFLAQLIAADDPALPPAEISAVATEYANAYAAQETAQTGLGANGYFQINALFDTLETAAAQIPTLATPVAPTIPASLVVPDAVATQVKALNAAYNQAIAQAASSTGAPLVDINKQFESIVANGGIYTGAGPNCCSLVYGGGFFSLDGLHPSNTGYAVLANDFITTIDASFGMSIPQVNVATISASDPYVLANAGVVGSFAVTHRAGAAARTFR
jgi:lysophospholipase L1-like esterase